MTDAARDAELAALRRDLAEEQRSLDEVVTACDASQWARPTPSPGWTVADQIGHLAYFDAAATRALVDPDGFVTDAGELYRAAQAEGVDAFTLGAFRALSTDAQLAAWRRARTRLLAAAATLDRATRVPWYGPSMGALSFLRARLMETWAHGVDVADALGVTREPTDRLRHVAELGYRTRDWSYRVRGEEPPPGRVGLDLRAPSGTTWTWGDDADEVITGPAEDFCLVVTQRRHVDDTALVVGDLGRHWLERAQAFAGPPTRGPSPRRHRG